MPPQPQTFSEWVRFFVERSGMTQAELERRMKVSKGTLAKWRSDDVGQPRRENLQAFADVLRLAPDERARLFELADYAVSLSSTLDAPDYAAARRRYLEALRQEYNFVEHTFIDLAQDERVGNLRRVALLGERGVYVPLDFDAPTARRAADEAAPGKRRRKAQREELAERDLRPLTLADVLRLPGDLALIGDAGSGKTTVLHVLVSLLAAENPRALSPDLADALPAPLPLPIFMPLRLFERACGPDDEHPGDYCRCAADLLRFVDEWFARGRPDVSLPPGFLAEHIRGGRAWLLLDALDEVADAAHRETLRNVIHELADYGGAPGGAQGGLRLIVTARVAAYRNTRLDERFAVVTVRDLDEDKRNQLMRAIYAGLALPDAEQLARQLSERFEKSDALRDLGRTPVMVWTSAVIHALRGELPEGRAALYDAYVDILLRHSFKRNRYDVQAIDDLTEGQGWPLPERRHYLTYAAFQTHRLLEEQPERHGERRAVVGEDELAGQVLAPYFQEHLDLRPVQAVGRAREFLTLMVERSGLIYETDQGYTIGDHLTMHEFLAGCYLADAYALEDPAGYAAFLRDKVGQTWWREVLLLAAGHLAEKPGFAARQFIAGLAAQGGDPAAQLVSLSLAARGLLQLRFKHRRPNWYTPLAQDLATRLYQRLYGAPIAAPVAARQEAGLALGLLYGNPGESDLLDPRFAHPGGLPDFICIQGGAFWMGSTEQEVEQIQQQEKDINLSDELPRHRVTLDTFELARFPTTHAMYARFVAEGGYSDERWWTEAMADKRWANGKVRDYVGERDQPAYWDDAQFNTPSQPVVGVTWYEAAAYCRWLTATLNDGYLYRLPTEAEWECAARGQPLDLSPNPHMRQLNLVDIL